MTWMTFVQHVPILLTRYANVLTKQSVQIRRECLRRMTLANNNVMTDKHILYATEFSLYSGKARSYLRYKRIPFDEVLSSLSVYRNTIIRKPAFASYPSSRRPTTAICKTPRTSSIRSRLHFHSDQSCPAARASVSPRCYWNCMATSGC